MQRLSDFYQSCTWGEIKSLSKTPVALTVYRILIAGAIYCLFYLSYLVNYWLLDNNDLPCTVNLNYCRTNAAVTLSCLEIILIGIVGVIVDLMYPINDVKKLDLETDNL